MSPVNPKVKAPKSEKPKADKPKNTSSSTTREKQDGSQNPWRMAADGTKVRNTNKLPFETKLAETLAEISGGLVLAGDEFTANLISARQPELAYGYAKLAQSDERVRKIIERLLEGSAWSAALLPTLSIALAVAWHYGLGIPDKIGLPITLAQGVMPMTRQQVKEARAVAHNDQQEAAAREAGANGAGGSASS